MDESRVTRTDTLNDFKVLVDNMTSPSSAFNILPLLTGVHKLSTWPLFRLIVGPDERNNDRNIIKVSSVRNKRFYLIENMDISCKITACCLSSKRDVVFSEWSSMKLVTFLLSVIRINVRII